MLQMSVDPQPVNLGSRIVTSTWLLFVLVIVSSYTANLTVFLGAQSDATPFRNLTEVNTAYVFNECVPMTDNIEPLDIRSFDQNSQYVSKCPYRPSVGQNSLFNMYVVGMCSNV